jgi:hypothetical protein
MMLTVQSLAVDHAADRVDRHGRQGIDRERTTALGDEFFDYPREGPEKLWSEQKRAEVYGLSLITSCNTELAVDFVAEEDFPRSMSLEGQNYTDQAKRLAVWKHNPRDLVVDSASESGYSCWDKRTKGELIRYVAQEKMTVVHPSMEKLKADTKGRALHQLEMNYIMRILEIEVPETEEGWETLEQLREKTWEEGLARQCHRLGMGRGKNAGGSIHRIRFIGTVVEAQERRAKEREETARMAALAAEELVLRNSSQGGFLSASFMDQCRKMVTEPRDQVAHKEVRRMLEATAMGAAGVESMFKVVGGDKIEEGDFLLVPGQTLPDEEVVPANWWVDKFVWALKVVTKGGNGRVGVLEAVTPIADSTTDMSRDRFMEGSRQACEIGLEWPDEALKVVNEGMRSFLTLKSPMGGATSSASTGARNLEDAGGGSNKKQRTADNQGKDTVTITDLTDESSGGTSTKYFYEDHDGIRHEGLKGTLARVSMLAITGIIRSWGDQLALDLCKFGVFSTEEMRKGIEVLHYQVTYEERIEESRQGMLGHWPRVRTTQVIRDDSLMERYFKGQWEPLNSTSLGLQHFVMDGFMVAEPGSLQATRKGLRSSGHLMSSVAEFEYCVGCAELAEVFDKVSSELYKAHGVFKGLADFVVQVILHQFAAVTYIMLNKKAPEGVTLRTWTGRKEALNNCLDKLYDRAVEAKRVDSIYYPTQFWSAEGMGTQFICKNKQQPPPMIAGGWGDVYAQTGGYGGGALPWSPTAGSGPGSSSANPLPSGGSQGASSGGGGTLPSRQPSTPQGQNTRDRTLEPGDTAVCSFHAAFVNGIKDSKGAVFKCRKHAAGLRCDRAHPASSAVIRKGDYTWILSRKHEWLPLAVVDAFKLLV